MPQEMPEFAMPPAASTVPVPPEAAAHEADPTSDETGPAVATSMAGTGEPSRFAPSRPERRFGWRQLVIVGLVCALLGVAIPFGVQASGRAAAAAEVEQLRSVAERYLRAIADGDAAVATALAPPARTVPVAPDAVLAAATRISQPEVVQAFVDGDTGAVQVRYRLRQHVITRFLDARQTADEWQLTSLVEQPRLVSHEAFTMPSVAGVELGYPTPLLLYPGWYPLDVVETAAFRSVEDGFTVDGIPSTDTQVARAVQLTQTMLDRANSRALAHAAECAESGACDWPATVRVRVDGTATWMGDRPTRLLFIQVPVIAQSGTFTERAIVHVSMFLDESGAVSEVSCRGFGGPDEEAVPCDA